MDPIKIIKAVIEGDLDDDLDGIASAVRDRQATKRRDDGRVKFHTLKAGDKVRLVNLRPKYLVGCEARVVRKNQSRVVIEIIDPPNGPNGRFSGPITASPDMLEPI